LGQAYLDIGDYEKAKQHYKTSLELYPMCFIFHEYCWLLGIETAPELVLKTADSLLCNISTCGEFCNRIKILALYMSGKFSQAEAYFNLTFNVDEIAHSWDSAQIASVYKELGREQQALAILYRTRTSLQNKLKYSENWLYYLSLSQIHALLDEKEKALESLSNAVDLGLQMGSHDLIKIYPPFENLWDEPEFRAIVKRAQDEKAAIRAQVQEMIESGEIDR